MDVAVTSHPECLRHEMGGGHPERPQRISAIEDQLLSSGLNVAVQHIQAPMATRQQLLRVHSERHVDEIFTGGPEEGVRVLDPDTAMNRHSLDAALHAAGAVVDAVDRVISGQYRAVFCNVRPPGHHAGRDRAMGFCLFNNLAVGIAHALAAHGLTRVAVVDFDVHHGNGTEDIFTAEPRVLLCSSFQHPFFPFNGADTVSDHIINSPLSAGAGSEAFREVVERSWLPALDRFAPELICFSAGFDAHGEDPLAGLWLSEADYAWVTRRVKAIAEDHAGGRMISTLEGGYDLSALGRSAVAHIDALLGH